MKAIHVCWAVMTIALAACSGGKSNLVSLDNMPVVTHKEVKDGQELTVCNLELIEDTIDLPLSYFVKDLQMVKLDNRDEALVGKGRISVSENYLLVASSNHIPYKLFRRDGTFVGTVGSIGQGPGEYTLVYDVQIDEKSGRIYMLPWNAASILVYDLQGKFEKSIPLNKKYEKLRVPKGRMKVDAENNRIGVVLLPFDYLPVVAWVQDMEGNFISETSTEHFKVEADFSNEVLSIKATDELSVQITGLEWGPLYHLDMNKGNLRPVYWVDEGNKELQIHSYIEYPYHYDGTVASILRINDRITTSTNPKRYLVDKQTGKGCFYRLYNDWLGDTPVSWLEGLDGYYTLNIEPGALLDLLEKVLKENTSLDAKRRKKLEEMKASIDEDDNNYIFVGKLTPPPSETKTFVKPEFEQEEETKVIAQMEEEPLVPGIRYEAVVKNEGAIRLDIEKALKNVRPMKTSEIGTSVKLLPLNPLNAWDTRPPLTACQDGYLFNGMEGLYLLDADYQKKKLLVKNDATFNRTSFTMDDVLLSPFYVDEAKGIVRCKKLMKVSHGAVAFSLKHLLESDSTLTTQDYQSLSPQMNPSLFTPDGFVTYRKNTGTFYTHSFRGDTLCRFQLTPDFLPTGNYRGPEGFSAYSLNGQNFVRLPYDKTVYRLVDNHTLQAVYQLDFGSLRYATGKEVVGTANIDNAYQVKGWIETDKFIFIRIAQGHDSPNNREKKAVKLHSLVYNKETEDFFSLPQPKELAYAALEGDLLEGMEWWPRSYQDGKQYRYCQLKTLKEYPALLKQIERVEALKEHEWILVMLE
ncbi:MAG: DUF4933 domain-containing protein [Bacteroides sp.]|nr:DUF4933 domain-containing protein [Bacteroides sp.]